MIWGAFDEAFAAPRDHESEIVLADAPQFEPFALVVVVDAVELEGGVLRGGPSALDEAALTAAEEFGELVGGAGRELPFDGRDHLLERQLLAVDEPKRRFELSDLVGGESCSSQANAVESDDERRLAVGEHKR